MKTKKLVAKEWLVLIGCIVPGMLIASYFAASEQPANASAPFSWNMGYSMGGLFTNREHAASWIIALFPYLLVQFSRLTRWAIHASGEPERGTTAELNSNSGNCEAGQSDENSPAVNQRRDTNFASLTQTAQMDNTSTGGKAHIRFAWIAAIFVGFFGTMMFRNENAGFATGTLVAGLVIGLLASPVVYLASRAFSKSKWHWYHWLNAATFAFLAIEICKWIFLP